MYQKREVQIAEVLQSRVGLYAEQTRLCACLPLQTSVGAKPGPTTMSACDEDGVSLSCHHGSFQVFLAENSHFFSKTNSLRFSSHIHRRVASLRFKAVWDGEFTTSLGSLFQWSVIPTVKNSYFISSPTTTSFAFQSLDLFLSLSALLKSPLHSKYSPTSVLTDHD